MTRAPCAVVMTLLLTLHEAGHAQLGTYLKQRAEDMARIAASETGPPYRRTTPAPCQDGGRPDGEFNSPGKRNDMQSRLVGCAAVLAFVAAPLAAQDSAATAGASAVTEAPVQAPKKKKGLLGKLKGIAQDKTVQQVAKVAACTMVPGGQYVAGAIDAGASAAEGNAGGAAAGAAGVATGSSCFGSGSNSAAAAGMMGGGGVTAGMTNLAVGAAAQAMTGLDQEDGTPAEAGSAAPTPLTPKQEKAFLKQMKKAGLSDEQAQAQLEVYRRMTAGADPDGEP